MFWFMEKKSYDGVFGVIKGLLLGVAHFIIDGIRNTHKEGHIFILISLLITLLFFVISAFLGLIGLIISTWCIYFFRDPHRVIPLEEGVLISPADGRITAILENEPAPEELDLRTEEKFTKISIFLNVFDVHVNRIPVESTVEKVAYIPGKFLNATLDKSSKENERNILLLKTKTGENIVLTQIAGLIARRIVSYAEEHNEFKTGQRYGIIRFGSRVDLYIPQSYKTTVLLGQTMLGGETIVACKK